MRIYDGEVAQWVEIYDLNDGELKRLYSSFRFGDNYEDGESDFISDMELNGRRPTYGWVESW